MNSSPPSFWAQILNAMSPIEIVGALLSFLAVVLTAKQNIWNFAVGIVGCVIYIYVFAGAKLYADAGLQVFFIAVCVWGWWNWTRGRNGENQDLSVSPMPATLWPLLLGFFLLGTGLQGYLLHRYTDAAAPYIDSGIFWASVGAQWMIGRKYIENWLIWIAVDVVATWLYWSKGLHPTSVLYAILTALAVWGWVSWLRSQKARPEIAPRPDGPPIALP